MTDSLEALTERLRRLGAPDPEIWARSECEEGIPQTAAYVALRNLWPDLIHPWRDPAVLMRIPATKALIDAGATAEAVSEAMCLAAYEAVFGTLRELDGSDAPDDAPHVHVTEVDVDCKPTGREVGGLYESLLGLDPTGQEGADFLS